MKWSRQPLRILLKSIVRQSNAKCPWNFVVFSVDSDNISRDFVQEVARMESPVLEHVTILIKDCFAPIADRDFDAILLIINITIKKNTNLVHWFKSSAKRIFFYLNFFKFLPNDDANRCTVDTGVQSSYISFCSSLHYV